MKADKLLLKNGKAPVIVDTNYLFRHNPAIIPVDIPA